MSQAGLLNVSSGDLPPDVPLIFEGNTGPGATALLNVLNVFGAGGTTVDATGNTLTVTSTTQGIITLTANNAGIATAILGNINVYGASISSGSLPVSSIASGNTLTLNVQRSQAISSSDSTKIGLSAFNSLQFTVDMNGFVSSIGSGSFVWVDATGSTQALTSNTGYTTDNAGGVVYTLPASAILGDIIKVVGKQGLATVTPNANQKIVVGSFSGTLGATGTIVATNAGDCLEIICVTPGTSTVWRADSIVGNWVLS